MKRLFVVMLSFIMIFSFLIGAVNPIKIGAVNPLGDITGNQSTKAMKLAVKEINDAGGVLGRPIELIVIDDEMNPAKGAAAIERLATVERVDFFVGGMGSGVHLAQIPILKKYQKITVWIGAASHQAEIAIGPNADWYFHLHPWDYQQGEGYGLGWREINEAYPDLNISKIFLAYEEGAFGTDSYTAYLDLYEQAKKGEGPWRGIMDEFKGASFKSAALGGGDYRAMLNQAKSFNPDLFVWAGYDADAIPIVAQAKEINFQPQLFVGAPPGWPADFGKNPLSNNVILYGMWSPTLNQVSPAAKHFYDAYVEMWKEEPATYFAPLGYMNIYFLVEGIKKAGTLDKEPLIKALQSLEFEDTALGEPLKIQPSNIIKNQGFKYQKILQWQNGKQEVIWPLDLQTADLVYPFTF
ncbi:ABC transporter substrate-binding protein [Petrotoga sp. 9PWA.NaAc.5.4]|uniref:ABC transporter substrate-binding protein n=1 Tax=Petrotoga sp. 9PWA.NaAc.5.4 TaxID=1434328 RepID=UPI000CBE0026|nr:ABC transporter substrate-binding protein [Petrotoga sp. 9PWA.NaAc.5.4]PNR95963.1 ABC transporter substrate-binding protein [Petrotoga sp. 9PWA.NaAc.5.4]